MDIIGRLCLFLVVVGSSTAMAPTRACTHYESTSGVFPAGSMAVRFNFNSVPCLHR
jgi:hypothetical protein